MYDQNFQYELNINLAEINSQNYINLENHNFHESIKIYNHFINKYLNENDDNKMLIYQIFNFHSAIMLLIHPEEDGKIILSNLAASNFYGYSQNELQCMKISDLNIMSNESIKQEMANAEKFQRNYFIFKHRLSDGSIKDVETYSTPLIIHDKCLLLSIIHDITETNLVQNVLKHANIDLINANNELSQNLVKINSLYKKIKISEFQLKELNSRKDKFFMIISHDLKTLLITLLQYANHIKKESETLSADVLNGLIDLAFDAGVNLNKLLEDLLDWSNLQTGKFEAHCNDYLLKDIVDNNIEIFKPEAVLKQIIFENQIDSYSKVNVDINILNTILRNLISNALKFSYHNSKIKIWSYNSEDEKNIIVVVEDKGIGINESEALSIFRIDRILRSFGTASETGTGLGLIITKDLIEMCGGEIWFESVVDSGTKFYFTLKKSK